MIMSEIQRSLVRALKDRVLVAPEKQVLVFVYPDDTTASISYGQLDADATRYAYALHNQGLNPGDLVILVFEHSYELVASFWGALYLGGELKPVIRYETYGNHIDIRGRRVRWGAFLVDPASPSAI